MCSPDRVPFQPLRVYQWPPFYIKIGLDIGGIFAKCLIFNDSFGLPCLPIGCQKLGPLMHPNIHGKKY